MYVQCTFIYIDLCIFSCLDSTECGSPEVPVGALVEKEGEAALYRLYSIHLSIYLSIYLFIYISIYSPLEENALFWAESMKLSIYLSIYLIPHPLNQARSLFSLVTSGYPLTNIYWPMREENQQIRHRFRS